MGGFLLLGGGVACCFGRKEGGILFGSFALLATRPYVHSKTSYTRTNTIQK